MKRREVAVGQRFRYVGRSEVWRSESHDGLNYDVSAAVGVIRWCPVADWDVIAVEEPNHETR